MGAPPPPPCADFGGMTATAEEAAAVAAAEAAAEVEAGRAGCSGRLTRSRGASAAAAKFVSSRARLRSANWMVAGSRLPCALSATWPLAPSKLTLSSSSSSMGPSIGASCSFEAFKAASAARAIAATPSNR
eukprot:scaffold30999_cov56-Phaeocystis_antarctica.AAC.2